MTNYKIVKDEITIDDYFIAFGVIGKCTEVDRYSVNSKETKWTGRRDCQKIIFID